MRWCVSLASLFMPPFPSRTLRAHEHVSQFDFNAEYDRYEGKPCPDPRLLAMGAEVGSVGEFTEKVLGPILEKQAEK